MKLRLRSFETKETLKVEVPNPCSLQHLRDLVSQKLPSLPVSSTVQFSLNRKDELTTPAEESIQSIGITSGDLIYFTADPNGFSTIPHIIPPIASSIPTLEKSENSQNPNPAEKRDNTLDLKSGNGNTVGFNNSNSFGKAVNVGFGPSNSEEIPESMEIDDDSISVSELGKSFSVPGFLRKVFTEELGDDSGLNHKLLAIAVRAVLLETGFVEFDLSSKTMKSNNFDLEGNWYSTTFYYTLSEITSNSAEGTGVINSVKIKFQNLGKYCKVYGSLVNGNGMHSVLLDEDRLVPFLNVVWANCGQVVETIGENQSVASVLPEKEVFEFWRKVKDSLALPLLMDLCEKSGLELPPCFMQLPTELKLKILESLCGVDIAKVSCVCSELRYLASSEDLWKQKYVEQFGKAGGSTAERSRSYKERFGKSWESRKRRRIYGRASCSILRRGMPYVPLGPGYFPRIIGGDYDMLPNLGVIGQTGGGVRRLRSLVPRCNLGGFDP